MSVHAARVSVSGASGDGGKHARNKAENRVAILGGWATPAARREQVQERAAEHRQARRKGDMSTASIRDPFEPPTRILVEGTAYQDLDRWHRAAEALRRAPTLPRVEEAEFRPFWAVTRHAEVAEIERLGDRFPNTETSVLLPDAALAEQKAQGVQIKSLVHMDDPEHTKYRKLTNEWFKPSNLRRLFEARVGELAKRYVDRMAEMGGACDFARDVALYYPLHVIMSILGVPEADEPRMLRLTQQLFGNEDPEFAGEDRGAALLAAALDFKQYFDAMTEDRRAHPRDDIATVLSTATIDGQPMPELERLGYYMIVATAGHDTTSATLAGGVEQLLQNPDQLHALQQDPSLIDNAVDEMIRWVTPVRHFLRQATEDYTLRGTRIAAGDWLMLVYLSANRDDAVFADPYRFDVRRKNACEHLAFGTGVHFCLGAHLARMELRAFLRELLPRLESIERAGPSEQTIATFVGGLKRLPVRYALRAAA
jgi:cytochrome P450